MSEEVTRRQVQIMTALGAVFSAGMFTFTGYFVFESPLWGGVAGLLVGAGAYLLLPYVMLAAADQGEETGVEDGPARPLAGVHPLAAGVALSVAGLAVMSTGFAAPDDLLLGVLVGALVAVGGYLPLSKLLPAA